MYEIKKNQMHDIIERYKARLVRNTHVEGLDFLETFAPVAKIVTIRTLLYVAARKWKVHKMDVHNAFLHRDLQEEVYIKLPPGFSHGNEGKVCCRQKSLYGLKQESRCWFAKLTSALKQRSFQLLYSDYSLFIYSVADIFLCVLVYVADFIIMGNNLHAL